jgi:hypothetical protein
MTDAVHSNRPVEETDMVTLALMCSDESLSAFCRRLACAVNQGPMHLARVLAVAAQVYPARVDSLLGEGTVLSCEFRMRRSGGAVTPAEVADLRRRLASFEVIDHPFVPAMVQVTEPASIAAAN